MTVQKTKHFEPAGEFTITLTEAELCELKKLCGYPPNEFVPIARLLDELASDLIEDAGGAKLDVNGNQIEKMAHAGGVRPTASPELIFKSVIDRAQTRAENHTENPLLTTARRMRGAK